MPLRVIASRMRAVAATLLSTSTSVLWIELLGTVVETGWKTTSTPSSAASTSSELKMLPSKNLFYALKLQGTFSTLTTRSIFKQFLPYPPLADLIPTQSTFESTNIKGAAIGFRSPAFVAGINQPGYHFHFVSDDRKMGGHALSFIAGEVTVQVQILRRHTILLPDNEPFLKATLPLPQN